MNTPSCSLRPLALAGLLVACVGLAFNASAQAKPEKSADTAESPTQGKQATRWELEVTDGILRGPESPATVGAIISYLREQHPANVVLAPGVGDREVQELKLAHFGWPQALEALKVASGDAIIWNRRSSTPAGELGSVGSVDPTTGMPLTVQRDDDLFVVMPNPEARRSQLRKQVEVFNMGKYLQGNDWQEQVGTIKDILMETLQNLGESEDPPKLQFHSSAKLLIIFGSPEQLGVARRVVLALPEVTSSGSAGMGSSGMGGAIAPPPPVSPLSPEQRELFLRRYGLQPGVPNAPVPVPPQPQNIPK